MVEKVNKSRLLCNLICYQPANITGAIFYKRSSFFIGNRFLRSSIYLIYQ